MTHSIEMVRLIVFTMLSFKFLLDAILVYVSYFCSNAYICARVYTHTHT